MHAHDFSFSHSLPMLYCCSWKVIIQHSTWANTHRLKHRTLLFQVSIDMVQRQGADPCRADTHRTPVLAKRGILQVHKYLQILCNSLLPHRRRMSDFTSKTFRPDHSFPPSLSRNGEMECCCVMCRFVGRDKAVFTKLSHCVQCTFPALINITRLIASAVLADSHVLLIREPRREKADDGVELREEMCFESKGFQSKRTDISSAAHCHLCQCRRIDGV